LLYAWHGVPDPDPLWLKPHVARLRDKLRAAGAPEPAAVRGVGYRIEETEVA
jgi:DNA-binding response OmpR family regulator